MASEEDSPVMKTVKGAVTGLAAGTIWGTVVATWYDVPRVERHVALPGLIRTLKMCGSYGATFAAVGGLYIGVEQLVQSQRKKHDFVNGAIGAFVAGATVYGYRGILHFQELNLGIIQPSHPPIRHATTTTTRGQLPGTGGKDLASADGGRTRLRDEQLRQLRELFLRFDLDELASSLAPLLLGPCRPFSPLITGRLAPPPTRLSTSPAGAAGSLSFLTAGTIHFAGRRRLPG